MDRHLFQLVNQNRSQILHKQKLIECLKLSCSFSLLLPSSYRFRFTNFSEKDDKTLKQSLMLKCSKPNVKNFSLFCATTFYFLASSEPIRILHYEMNIIIFNMVKDDWYFKILVAPIQITSWAGATSISTCKVAVVSNLSVI